MSHLLRRIEDNAETGYREFKINDESLCKRPIERMSKLTDALLSSIDYDSIRKKRRKNYQLLDTQLSAANLIHFSINEDDTPMIYPYLTDDITLRQRLIRNRIFVATYWPNLASLSKNSFEKFLMHNMIPLPIDQRYGEEEMQRIIDLITNQQ